MSIDYKQLQLLVKEAMFTNGGINEPSAPEGVPHRMPAADKDTPEQDGAIRWTNKNVWNNDGDTATLLDASGNEIAARTC